MLKQLSLVATLLVCGVMPSRTLADDLTPPEGAANSDAHHPPYGGSKTPWALQADEIREEKVFTVPQIEAVYALLEHPPVPLPQSSDPVHDLPVGSDCTQFLASPERLKLAAALEELRSVDPGSFYDLKFIAEAIERPDPDHFKPICDAAARLKTYVDSDVERLRDRLWRIPALVVSGAVSLGSYQAGFLDYYVRFLRNVPGRLRALPNGEVVGTHSVHARVNDGRFHVVTGASAGSINAFIAALSGCLENGRIDVPASESLFYRTWIPTGLTTLYDPSKVGADNVFIDPDDQTSAIAQAEKVLSDLFDKTETPWRSCKFYFGATLTRTAARTSTSCPEHPAESRD